MSFIDFGTAVDLGGRTDFGFGGGSGFSLLVLSLPLQIKEGDSSVTYLAVVLKALLQLRWEV
jgi:hypothetical protein